MDRHRNHWLVLFLVFGSGCGGCPESTRVVQLDGSKDGGVGSDQAAGSDLVSGRDRFRDDLEAASPDLASSDLVSTDLTSADRAAVDAASQSAMGRDGGLFSGFDGGSGTHNCGETFQCILLVSHCALDDQPCRNACYAQATPEAQRLVEALADCAFEPCGYLIDLVRNGQISQDDLINCVILACPSQLTACYVNSQPPDAGVRD